ncbi:MAG: FmdB family transcriptional regulator, partial [Actinomycetota bacterium]
MPTYVYKFVETGETIEVLQAFTDDALTEATHPEHGRLMSVKKVFQPVGVTFKGGGFYKTDSRGSASGTKAAAATA